MPDRLILCYHAVSNRWDSPLAIEPEALASQVRAVLRRGFEPTTFTGAARATGRTRVVAVTFDDAFRSVFDLARPVLAELGVPATVFVPTAYPGSGRPLAWPGLSEWQRGPFEGELACMEWDHLRTLGSEGWEIGAHTVDHPLLTRVDDDRLARELADSRARCAQELGAPCTSLAYPYGDVDDRVAAATAEAGFEAGADLGSHFRVADPMRIPRVGVYRGDDPRRFAVKTSHPLRWSRRFSIWDRADSGKASRRTDLDEPATQAARD